MLELLSLKFFFYLSAGLFALGIFLVITRRNAVLALLGIELILNAANLNLVAFSRQEEGLIHGHMGALFVMVLAAAEAAVALAIILNVYQQFRSVNIEEADELRG
jgi:NADH-quinone oxidoreductase subunit K